MNKEEYENDLKQVKESHRMDLFLVFWIGGEIMLAFFFKDLGGWGYFICSWIVVFIAWKLSGPKK